eukprot:TRINITY_DN1739_c0_g1_i4.p1 TRINITY_DN1739_c0_g1~~TRINITY_DN1739_c0_g1_i4.p1  ORF type:complete len:254 (-),score=75.76 TRINITY_DN1739_c0_g1_i4:250-906(-)
MLRSLVGSEMCIRDRSTLEDLLCWFPFRSALSRRYNAVWAVKTGMAKDEVEALVKELSVRVQEHDRVQHSDAIRFVEDYPLCCAVLGVTTAHELMQRYDSDLCGTLDALEMSELKTDLLRKFKDAQRLAVEVEAASLLPENPYEQEELEELLDDDDATETTENPLHEALTGRSGRSGAGTARTGAGTARTGAGTARTGAGTARTDTGAGTGRSHTKMD